MSLMNLFYHLDGGRCTGECSYCNQFNKKEASSK